MNNLKMVYESLTPLPHVHDSVKIEINGESKLYHVISHQVIMKKDGNFFSGSYPVYIYELIELWVIKTKSNEQIAAEESVAKDKEALEAAENALKVVKEQSK